MASEDLLRNIALALPEVTEEPHFNKTSFRVAKKIFATMAADSGMAMVKLSLADQDVFCAFSNKAIYPVPNKWGKNGATYLNLSMTEQNFLVEIVKRAYKCVAPKKLGDLLTFNND